MKKLFLSAFAFMAMLSSCVNSTVQVEEKTDGITGATIVGDLPTTQAFLSDPLPEEDVTRILKAAVNTPSAINQQPWHFTAVTNQDVLKQINSDMSSGGGPGAGRPGAGGPGAGGPGAGAPTPGAGVPPVGGSQAKAGIADAPLVVIVSSKSGQDLNAGLATQTIAIQAQLMGYGSKIIAAPTHAINSEGNIAKYRQLLGIPEDMESSAMVLIGKTDESKFDATTSATPRNAFDDVVSIVK